MKATAKPDVDPLDLTFADDAARASEIARASKRPVNTIPTPRQWAAALIETRGLKWRAAALLATSTRSLDACIAECPALADVHADARERMLDDAEAKLADKAIEEGDGECLRYLLKTVGKDRGYGEKVQHDLNITDGAAALTKLKAKLGVVEE